VGNGNKRVVLALDSETLGRGDDRLGAILMEKFLRTVAFLDEVPEEVLCYNTGVKLAAQGSPAVPLLQAMEQKGADIVCCGTCVEYFSLKDRLAVGRVGGMQGIVEALARADKVITV